MKSSSIVILVGGVVAISFGFWMSLKGDGATGAPPLDASSRAQGESPHLEVDGEPNLSPLDATREPVNAPSIEVETETRGAEETSSEGLTLNEVNLIRENLDGLYAGATKAQLIDGYRNSYASFPRDLLGELHQAHVEAGNYEVLDHPITKPGEPYVMPNVKASPLAHGLVRVNLLDDGRSVKTELGLDELGQHAALAVELGWFELAIERAGRREKAEMRR